MSLTLGSRRNLWLVGLLGAAACSSFAAPTTTALSIVSDGSWRSSATLVPDWSTVGFDDSAWSFARASYPGITPPGSLIAGSAAQMMWHDPTASSNGANGAIQTWYRRSFTLDLSSVTMPPLGQAIVFADDDFEFYVNGSRVYADADGGAPEVPHFIDFSPFLVNGNNVLAIHAVDGALSAPYDRVYEYVLVDAIVRTVSAVPEPSTIALMLCGFLGVSLAAKRRAA
jgi:PEP-CTERM motif